MSRLGVLGLIVLVALVVAAGAAATSAPPRGGAQSLPRLPFTFLTTTPARGRAACHEHGRQGPATVRKYAKKLAPVSCEQPPRANVVNTGSNLIITP